MGEQATDWVNTGKPDRQSYIFIRILIMTMEMKREALKNCEVICRNRRVKRRSKERYGFKILSHSDHKALETRITETLRKMNLKLEMKNWETLSPNAAVKSIPRRYIKDEQEPWPGGFTVRA